MRLITLVALIWAVASPAAAQPRWHHHYDYYRHDWPRPMPRYENPLGAILGGIIGGFFASRLDHEDQNQEEDRGGRDEHR